MYQAAINAQDLTTAEVTPEMDPTKFIGNLYATYVNQGEEQAEKFMLAQLEAGLDVSPLREAIFNANNGHPVRAEVEIHPDNAKMILFFNSMLRRSGFDFIEVTAKNNPSLTPPLKPFKEDAEAHARWKASRKFWVPLISILATMIPAIGPDLLKHGIDGLSFGKAFIGVIQAAIIFKIEGLTSIYDAVLDKALWSPEHFQRPGEDPPGMGRLKKAMRQFLRVVSDFANKHIVDRTGGFIKAGYIYNYSFNWVYAFAIFTIGWTGAMINNYIFHGALDLTAAVEYKTMGKFMLQNFLGTLGFYFAFGVNQTLIGVLKARGVLSEFQRLKTELVSLYFAKPGRILASTNEGYWVGVIMTAIVGVTVTVPTIIKMYNMQARVKRMRQLMEENAVNAREARLAAGGFRPLSADAEDEARAELARPVDTLVAFADTEAHVVHVSGESSPARRNTRTSQVIRRQPGVLANCLKVVNEQIERLNWLQGHGRPTY